MSTKSTRKKGLSISSLKKIFRVFSFLLIVASVIGFYYYFVETQSQVEVVKFGAGKSTGDAFLLASAIKKISEEHYPSFKLELVETKGSKENISKLEANEIQLGTVQADIAPTPSCRLVANLYPDYFQLIVRKELELQNIHDIKGLKIALPSKGGGQYISFQSLMKHYEIDMEEIQVIDEKSIDIVDALNDKTIDGFFKVRALHNEYIQEIFEKCDVALLPIDQGDAMKIEQPSLEEGIIPIGAYKGYPPVPDHELSTVAVQRLLLSNDKLNPDVVNKITTLLFENRRELIEEISLAGFISQPNTGNGTMLPIQKGAKYYYDKDQPHFLIKNASLIAPLMSVFVGLFTLSLAFKRWLSNKKKNTIDAYNNVLLDITEKITNTFTMVDLAKLKKEHIELWREVIDDVNQKKIPLEGFQYFSSAWKVTRNLLSERQEDILRAKEKVQ